MTASSQSGFIHVRFLPIDVEVDVPTASTVMTAAALAGIALEHPCGGRGICGDCLVKLHGNHTKHSSADFALLSQDELQNHWFLSCQTELWNDVVIECSAGRKLEAGFVMIDGVGAPVELLPRIVRIEVELPPPSLDDQRDDIRRLLESVIQTGYKVSRIKTDLLFQLPALLRQSAWKVQVFCLEDEIIEIRSPQQSPGMLGIAVDVGTTTVVASINDLETGKTLAVSGFANEQLCFGSDVISRIQYAMEHPDGLAALQNKMVQSLDAAIQDMLHRIGREAQEILQILAVGNTTMQQLLLGINPSPIARSPFIPISHQAIELEAKTVGFQAIPTARLSLAPVIAGYVGGDIVADILASGIHEARRPCLLVDIGTNAEIVVGCKNRLIACASPAGPAFEGMQICRGMRALPGAISSIEIVGQDFQCETIGGKDPEGLCGSGLIDLLSILLNLGVVNAGGRMLAADEYDGPGWVKERIRMEEELPSFFLTSNKNKPIQLTSQDVRALQLAKGAVQAGILVLLKQYGITMREIDQVFIAGAFGNKIRPESAKRVGLIPAIPLERVKFLGNTAHIGAQWMLLSKEEWRTASLLSHQIQYFELSGRLDFQETFGSSLGFAEEGFH